MRSIRLITILVAASAALACQSPDDEPTTAETEAGDDESGKADSASSELDVRAANTTVWLDRTLRRDGDAIVLDGRASRTITDGFGFVFDDVYGAWSARGPKSFSMRWQDSELTSLFSGVNQFVRLSFTHSNGRPDTMTARVVVRPRLVSFTGASEIYLTAELTPVVSGGRTVYRVKGHATKKIYDFVSVDAGGVSITDFRQLDDTNFQIDLLADHVIALAGRSGAAGQLQITVNLLSGHKTKRASLGLSVKKLGLTADDAYEVWPVPSCTTATRTCLAGLPSGTLDLGSCGEAILVNACQGQLGATVDDVAFSAALAQAGQRLATPAVAADARALVGAERADSFIGNAEQLVESRLEGQFGRWYASVGARDAALDAEIDAAINLAYARPLDLVEPLAPLANDPVRARHIAADALLEWLATHDLRMTEWGRPLEELTLQYRAQHVESLRVLREDGEVLSFTPGEDIYLTNWLGAHVEATITRSTGVLKAFLFEID